MQARLVGEFITGIEQSFEELADMAGLTRPQLLVVRKWWREQRQRAAGKFGADAETHPEFVEDPAA